MVSETLTVFFDRYLYYTHYRYFKTYAPFCRAQCLLYFFYLFPQLFLLLQATES